MKFLDQKEEVFDIQLTPTGNRLLQLGQFKPASYCFFDDDVIYDGEWAGVSPESQNDIETRIQDIPKIEPVRAKYSVEDEIFKESGTQISEYDVFANLVRGDYQYYLGQLSPSQLLSSPSFYEDALGIIWTSLAAPASLIQNDKNRLYSMDGPLGTMDYMAGDMMPGWNIEFMKSELTGSIYVTGSMGEKIFQLKTDLQYHLVLDKTEMPDTVEAEFWEDDPLHSLPMERVGTSLEDLNATPISLDGTYIYVKDDYLFLRIREENTRFLEENFEIEIFKLNPRASGTKKSEEQLFFDDPNIDSYGLIYGDTTDPALKKPPEALMGGSREDYRRSNVNYFFDVLVDHEIPQEIYCRAMQKDEIGFDFLERQMFNCVDIVQDPELDPYNVADEGPETEICD